VAVIAPLFGSSLNSPFSLHLKSGKELTIRNISLLARNGFNPSCLPATDGYDEHDSTAAGYFLSGALRANGYDTVLISHVDDQSMYVLSRLDIFAVCISTTMIVDRNQLCAIARELKAHLPGIPVLAGGPLVWKSYIANLSGELRHAVTDQEDWQLFPAKYVELCIDGFIVSPHGVAQLMELLARFLKQAQPQLSDIPNISLPNASDGAYCFTDRVDERVDYNAEITRWDLLDKLPTRVPIRSSIGCPQKCLYCDFNKMHPGLFLRNKQSLLRELELLKRAIQGKRSPVTMLAFSDDNIFLNRSRVEEVCMVMIESGINKHWGGFIRSDQVTENNIDLVKSSGFYMGMTGVESGDTRQIARMKKGLSLSKAKKGIELLDDRGIPVLMTFLVGFPGECEETIANTIGFINNVHQSSGLTSYQLYPMHVAPLSALSSKETRAKYGLEGLFSKWKHATMDSKKACQLSYQMFRNISRISYSYHFESYGFNRQIPVADLRKLYDQRKQITIDLVENAHPLDIASRFNEFGQLIGAASTYPPESFIQEIERPSLQ